MPLTPPRLDSRTFKDLMDEAKARLPRYTPEWVNFNDSDPGMALVQLHAWMTETILYELNRVPELNYLKFLELLGVVPEPAHPARTELEFTLKDPQRVTVNIPRLTQVAVDDPAAPTDLVFETDRTLTAIDAAIGALILPEHSESGVEEQPRNLVTRFEKGQTVWAHNFDPFPLTESPASQQQEVKRAFYLGLHLRPGREDKADQYTEDRFPAGPLDLYVDAVRVFDKGAGLDAAVIQGPIGTFCPPPNSSDSLLKHLSWQVFTGTDADTNLFTDDSNEGWTPLSLSEDSTRALSGSGHLVFEIPATISALDPMQLSREFWTSFGATRPPQTHKELVEQLNDTGLNLLKGLCAFKNSQGATAWELMGAADSLLDELLACDQDEADVLKILDDSSIEPLDPAALELAEWVKINDVFSVAFPQNAKGYRPLYWLRGRLDKVAKEQARPTTLRGFYLNTVPATQAATRFDDQLGRSNGRPGQVFKLPKVPVLIDPATGKPDLELEMIENGQAPEWIRVDDFYTSGAEDPHYMLDPVKGEIHLGDGRRGRIPVAGSTVTAVRYRVGGGAVGNVTAGLVSKLKGGLRDVKAVSNRRAAHDGAEAETLAEVKARAPHDLRSRDRAVSAEDFADLAMRTPGVALHRVYALPRRAVVKSNTQLMQDTLIKQDSLIEIDRAAEDTSVQQDTLLKQGTLIKQDTLVEKDGAVTLLVLPVSDQLTPQPDESQKRAISRWLEPRRLITTELHIIGPRYVRVSELQARLMVQREYDLGAVTAAVTDALLKFLSPLLGGEEGLGWPFDADIYYGDLYQQILAVPGVRRASGLKVKAASGKGEHREDAGADDVVEIPEGCLPALSRDVIALVAGYE